MSELERRQLEGLKGLNEGYQRWNHMLLQEQKEAMRVIIFLLRQTGPVLIPDIVTRDGTDRSAEIVMTRDEREEGMRLSLREAAR